MDASCSATEVADVDVDSDPSNLVKTEDGVYMESLVRVSLLLFSKDFSPEVQSHGSKMLKYLLKHRSDKLSSADLLNLNVRLKSATSASEDAGTETAKLKQQSLLGNDVTMFYHQRMGCSLLTEHNLLCEAFVIATNCLRIQQYVRILPVLLNSLNTIWTLKEWKYKYVHMGCLFSDGQFLNTAHYVVKFCEEQLKRSCDIFSVALLKSILCLLLQLLQWIHALWTVEAKARVDLLYEPGAESLSCAELAHMLESTDGLYNIDNGNERRALLEGIRHRGYSVIGLCTSVEGAFSELLDSLSVGDALIMEGLEYMEFRHFGKLIRLVVIPLVERCPCELWKEWMVNFLKPMLIQCDCRLHFVWFGLLYNRRVKKPYYFGNLVGLDEEIQNLEQKLLLKFTQEVSGLLGVLAREEKRSVLATYDKDNASLQDLESTSSSSFFRFLLHHDCFGRLRMSLFGYFVDDEAAVKAIPFCRSLICLAASINDDARFRIFIMDDLLPYLIRRLDNQLQCATPRLIHKLSSSASDSASRELLVLCQEIYDYCVLKDFAGEGKYIENNFTAWLAKQKEDQVKACSAGKELLEGSEWNWEFEDEFQRYLPAYMDMVKEVDSMDNIEERVSMQRETLFQKLKQEFRSKYGINSCEHPYMVTLSSIRKRQFCTMSGVIYHQKKGKFVSKLIKLKPYIKASDSSSNVIYRLQENSEIQAELPDCALLPSVELLLDVLFIWEPRFHPLIRKSHMDILLWFVDQIAKTNDNKWPTQVVPSPCDFELHLQPYAYDFIETKHNKNMYYGAIEQIRLHEEFDSHLASTELDCRVLEFKSSKDEDDFVKNLLKNELEGTQFSALNHGLIKLSLEIVSIRNDVCAYSEYLRRLLENELLKGHLRSLMNELQEEGFFDTDNDSVNWEKQRFSELVDEFKDKVFAERPLPKHYVIRAIIDYRSISMWKDSYQKDVFYKVVDEVRDRWIVRFEQFWRETRYYEHRYYNIVRRPLEMVFMK